MTTSEIFDQEPPFWVSQSLGDREYVAQETERFVVAVLVMGFNDRIVVVPKDEYGRGWTAGYCYHKGGEAFIRAMIWNPEEDQRPQGFKKIAFESRPLSSIDEEQLVCQFCAGDAKLPTLNRCSPWGVNPAEGHPLDGRLDLACVICGSVEPPKPMSQREYAWFLTDEGTEHSIVRAFQSPRGEIA